MTNQPGYQPHLNGGVLLAIIVFYAALIVFFGWLYVRIIRRTGYSGWWVLMALVPIGNIVMLILFAFKEWPILREVNYLRGYAAYTGLPGYAVTPQGSDAGRRDDADPQRPTGEQSDPQ